MTFVLALAGCIGEAAIIYAILILTRLSQKLGAVTKMPPYYNGYYLALGLLCISVASRLVRVGVVVTNPTPSIPLLHSDLFYLATHHVPLALGTAIALGIAVKYWGWLLKE